MNKDPNFPRMMFHRVKEPVTVHSQDELDALGREWAMKPFMGDEPAPAPVPAPVIEPPVPAGELEPDEPEERAPKHHAKAAARKGPAPSPKPNRRGRR